MTTPRIVPEEEADRIRSRPAPLPGQPSADQHLAALLRGDTLHFDDRREHFNRADIRRRYGLRLRERSDGSGGRYYWTEAIVQPDGEPSRG